MNASLSLPSLTGLPVQMLASYATGRSAALALAMLDAGHLQPAHTAKPWATPTKLCERAIATWWHEVHPRFEVLPRLFCHVTRQEIGSHWTADEQPDDTVIVHVGRHAGRRSAPQLLLQRRIEALERDCPGWGFRVLAHLERASLATIQVLTPHAAYGMASWSHWLGEVDDVYAQEQMREEGIEPNDADLYTTAEFFRQIPKAAARLSPWGATSRKWHPPRGTRYDSALVARCDRIRGLVNSAAVKRLNEADLRRNDGDGGAWIEFGAIARWNEHDDCIRMLDDWYNVVTQETTWETFGSWQIHVDAKTIRGFFADIAVWMALAAELDALLVAVGEPA